MKQTNRVIQAAFFSALINMAYAAVNFLFGVTKASLWFASAGVYYAVISITRFAVLLLRKRRGGSAVALCAGVMLMLTSVPLLVMAVICGFYDVGSDFHEILMITIALYAFSKITFAAVNLAKSRKRSIPWESALRSVSLADALVSIASLQRSMLVSFGEMEQYDIRLFNIITGSGVGICIFFIGLLLFMQTRKKIKAKI